jgi:hypothetical protein
MGKLLFVIKIMRYSVHMEIIIVYFILQTLQKVYIYCE